MNFFTVQVRSDLYMYEFMQNLWSIYKIGCKHPKKNDVVKEKRCDPPFDQRLNASLTNFKNTLIFLSGGLDHRNLDCQREVYCYSIYQD